ncbi:MAG TPA: DUF1922 domain-containing protein [Candidatus Bathyarchaeota archaeon]|nr:MAG: hypothetical protein DRJ30_00620 [Candidatus Verstraetearchaeota archaeon]HDO20057.1 DUF1922 domain-containing protein [Candidatus Bathyarchaeota archaeon]
MPKRYLAVKCPHCGDIRAISSNAKSFQCFTCGKRVKIRGDLILESSNDHHEISRIVRFLKMKSKKR